jgi:gliding motility-associated-like protein
MKTYFFAFRITWILLFLVFSTVLGANAQCPTSAGATLNVTSNVTCDGLRNGSVYFRINDAVTTLPTNYELFDVDFNTVRFSDNLDPDAPHKVVDPDGRGVTFSNIEAISGLSTYTVRMFRSGCSGSSPSMNSNSFEISEPPPISATLGTITTSCASNGAIAITVSGGTPLTGGPPNYVYIWTGPTAIANTVEDPTGLSPGTYSVTIRDANYNAGNPGFCEATIPNIVVPGPLVPSVSIVANPAGTICSSTSVTFTATPTNGGTPSYQWRKNGLNVGTNSATYTDAALVDDDQISVVMTTSETCVTSPTATSNTITMDVTTPVTPSVNIVANPTGTICSGTSVTFTATPTNGGATPSYQWRKNGLNVGTNSATYTDATLADNDEVSVVMTTSLTCVTSATATSNTITMDVTTPVTPSVGIVANPVGTICGGTSVTFTATPTNGGATPGYQWRKNGLNVGTNSSTYTDATLADNDQISVIMTSSLTCVTSPTATSNTITMDVTTPLVPSVSIVANPTGTICSGTSVTFTASPTNGGTPSYQWRKNGVNVGTNSATYTDATLADNDQISVVMTTSLTCVTSPTATSNIITMDVTTPLVPSVSIVANPTGTICIGTSVTFTATPTNGGTPSYQWRKNGINVGTNSATYTDAALIDDDQISVVMTTSETCVTSPTATSNTITMDVTTPVTPSVNIVANPTGTICSGTSVTFTATPTNGGATPSYQWRKNGLNVGTNSATYTDATLAENDEVSVVMTTSLTCVTSATATSNTITMDVTTPVTPSVSIVANPVGTICGGTSVTFTATPTNGGATPGYQWRKNGLNVGTNSATYTDATLADNDQISVIMTSSLTCVTSPTATSNTITMDVTTPLVPSVSIVANPTGTICSGTSVTFTATPTNGGTPSYQWRKNGVNVGTNSATYTDATLADNDQISVVMTTSLTCVTSPTATSNIITMDVTTPLVPSVSISANPSSTICNGTSVTFTANPTNGGGTPSYQWRKNGLNVGTNSSTYTDASLVDNDQISVVMTTSLTCVTSPTATSNTITIDVTTPLVPSVSITANPSSTICSGTSVTFTATPTNGGGTPTYQWRKNGLNVGTNSATYTDATLADNDQISVVMTTSLTCVTSPTATSNIITIDVTAPLVPTVSIIASPNGSVCTGTSVTFTATPTNGGGTPSYQWIKNGANVGTNSATYTDAALVDNDQISVVMTTSLTCVTSPTATSNSITMDVTAPVTPSVSIVSNPTGTICSTTSVTFTANPTNGGATPSYQWIKNGLNVGTNSATYTDASLADNDQISVVMTTSLTCVTSPTATSNTITMDVTTSLVPSVSIVASPTGTVCSGTSVTFTATPTNGGTPGYQWRKNGLNVGTNSATYTDATLADNDQISVIMTSSLTCVTSPTATSNTITMDVITPLVPSVSIVANPAGTICSGTSVTFTATPTNGGTPSYQWRKNGINVGTNSATYTDAALVDNDQISVVMTTSETCVTSPTATSNTITMDVTTPVTPSVNIVANPTGTICSGTSVTFTATPTNGGATPSYQWRKNGLNVGTNSATYTDATLADNDEVSVVMTTSLTCVTSATATSNTITMDVTTPVTPSVGIVANPVGTICGGTSVTFTATPTNGGATPGYQWRKNGLNVGTNSATYTDATLADNDQISVIMTSSLTCVTSPTATSNTITMDVTAPVTPSVSIVSNPTGTICSGTSVTFTATPTNGGATPSYQWIKNGANVGTNSATYTDAALADNDVISVVMTTTETCVTSPTATSNTVTMDVTTPLVPSVSISANPSSTICNGTSVTFTANPTNGGGTPSYQWIKNGGNVGTNSATYTDAALADNDVISVVMTTSETCVTSPTATSNTITMDVIPQPNAGTGSTLATCNTATSFDLSSGLSGADSGGTWTFISGPVTINPTGSTVNLTTASAGAYVYRYTVTAGPCTPATADVTVNVSSTPSASISGNSTVCVGSSANISLSLTGGGPWNVVYTDGTNNFNINNITATPHTFSVSPVVNTTYSLVSVSNTCGAGTVNPQTVDITVSPIPGNPNTFGTDTWIGYVYNDAGDTRPIPTPRIDFNLSKYRGFIEATDINNQNGVLNQGGSYDVDSDQFNLNLSTGPVFGPNVCGSYQNDFSMRFRMRKSFIAGIYTFTLGADDGVRLYVDNVLITLNKPSPIAPEPFNLHSYIQYTSNPICLTAGNHDLVIEYYERGTNARISFAYTATPDPVVDPVSACINTSIPTLSIANQDPTATQYRWFTDAALTNQTATGTSFTPDASELDMSVAGSTSFYVVAVYGTCQTPAEEALVTVVNSTTLTADSPTPQVCESGGSVDLTDFIIASTTGGTFTFTASAGVVTGNNFDPTGLPNGPVTIQANYTVGGGCSASLDFDINVTNSATITVPAGFDVCAAGDPIDLTTLISTAPAGGTLSITIDGVASTTNIFDPTDFSEGDVVPILVDYSTGSCVASQASFNITIEDTPVITVTAGTVCSGGSANLLDRVSADITGGTFSFSGTGVTGNTYTPPSGTTGNQTVNYTYTISGCAQVSGTITMNVSTGGNLNFINSPVCQNGGVIDLNDLVSGTPTGGTLAFGPATGVTGNNFDPTGLSGIQSIPASYTLNGCTTTGNLLVSVLNQNNPLCQGGSGGGTGQCATVKITPEPIPANCADPDGSIIFHIKPWVPANNILGVVITIDGPVKKTQKNDSIFTDLQAGLYNYEVIYGDDQTAGCITKGSVVINKAGTAGYPEASAVLSPKCFGDSTGSVTIEVTKPVDITGQPLEWSLTPNIASSWKAFTAGGTIVGIPAGLAPNFEQAISIRKNASDPCYAGVTVVVPVTAKEIRLLDFDTKDATCNANDGAIENIAADGNGSTLLYSLNGGIFQPENEFTRLIAGDYSLTIRDQIGCEKTFDEIVIKSPGFISADILKTDADCENSGNSGSIEVAINDAGSFEIALSQDEFNEPDEYERYFGPTARFTNLSSGQYYIYMKRTDDTQCPTRRSVEINGVDAIDFAIVPICESSSLSFSLTGITRDPAEPIRLRVFKKLTSIKVLEIPITLSSTNSYLMDYNDAALAAVLKVPGEYQIELVQMNQTFECEVKSPLKDLTVPFELKARITKTVESYPDIANGKLTIGTFTGGVTPYETRIELDSASSFAFPAYDTDFEEVNLNSDQQFEKLYSNVPPGRYIVQVRDSLGCSIELVSRVPMDSDIFIPNVITPNEDGTNDVFFIRNLSTSGVNKLQITNRWGKEIYSSDNYQNNWEGEGAADGIYFYRLQVSGKDPMTGWVEIMRGQKP